MPKIIALCGQMHNGKSTAAKFYQSRGYELISFAAPLKSALQIIFGLSNEEMANKDTPTDVFGAQIAPRQLLQHVGTELFQYNLQMPHIGRNIWALNLAQRMEKHKKYIIDDMRFLHEYETLKKYYPEMITILIHNSATAAEASHESERVVCPINYRVANLGTVSDLYDALSLL
jgi:dephospho-CoA kinase